MLQGKMVETFFFAQQQRNNNGGGDDDDNVFHYRNVENLGPNPTNCS